MGYPTLSISQFSLSVIYIMNNMYITKKSKNLGEKEGLISHKPFTNALDYGIIYV
jgi:hypothetical protein